MNKIYYITATYPYGKGESFLSTEIAGWQKNGVAVEVVPTYPRGALQNGLASSLAPLKPDVIHLTYLYCTIKMLVLKPLLFFKIILNISKDWRHVLKNLFIFPRSCYVASYMLKNPAAHIHAHWASVSSTLAMIVSDFTSIPWSMTCHRWDIYDNNLLHLKSEKASFVRFISNRGMIDAIELGAIGSKCHVIHMGVSVDSRKNKNSIDFISEFAIFCVANLVPVKGHKYLFEAAKILIEKGFDFKIHVYGDGPLRRDLALQVESLRLNNNVFFHGHALHEDILRSYKNGSCSLLVLPSIEFSHELHEGVPVSLMEAMSYGIPVVSTNTGSINELLPESLGLTVPDKDSMALAGLMAEFLADRTLCKNVSSKVVEIINAEWTADATINKLHSLVFNGVTYSNLKCNQFKEC